MNTKRVPTSALRFEAPVAIKGEGQAGDTARRFSGIAYSGHEITGHFYWGKVVFDLDTVQLPERLPALVGHDRDKIAGYADQFSVDHEQGIVVAGPLTQASEYGRMVAAMSDEGFPWQMSVHINPGSVEEVLEGQAIEVNGRQFTGPGYVFRNGRIREVSFTPTGWDDKTRATAMADGGAAEEAVHFIQREESTVTLEELKAKFEQQSSQLTELQSQFSQLQQQAQADKERADQAEAQLQAFQAEAERQAKERHAAAVQQLFSDLGREFSEEAAKPYLEMAPALFAQVAQDMRAARPQADESLFSETAPAAEEPLAGDLAGASEDDRKAIEYAAGL